jgi:hypothetical protein
MQSQCRAPASSLPLPTTAVSGLQVNPLPIAFPNIRTTLALKVRLPPPHTGGAHGYPIRCLAARDRHSRGHARGSGCPCAELVDELDT